MYRVPKEASAWFNIEGGQTDWKILGFSFELRLIISWSSFFKSQTKLASVSTKKWIRHKYNQNETNAIYHLENFIRFPTSKLGKIASFLQSKMSVILDFKLNKRITED